MEESLVEEFCTSFVRSLVPRPHPQGERVWCHKPELGLVEVLRSCEHKNANLKNESHHSIITETSAYFVYTPRPPKGVTSH